MDATNNEEWGDGEELYIMVAVKDSGIGISTVNQEKLFMRFRQATPMTNVEYGGSGLGLNISRKICQLHGGEIGVSSKENEGSTFGFFFKVRRPSNAAGGDESKDPAKDSESDERLKEKVHTGIEQASPGTASGSESETMPFEWRPTPTQERASYFADSDNKDRASSQKVQQNNGVGTTEQTPAKQDPPRPDEANGAPPEDKVTDSTAPRAQHILLVEDNLINQRLLSRKLEKKGFKVTTANNGEEAVNKVKDKPSSGDASAFDMILMDKEMPVLDGNSATKEIRELEIRSKVQRAPIIGVTANVRGEQQDEMIASGMDDVLTKPYEIDEMVNFHELFQRQCIANIEQVAKIHKVTRSRDEGNKSAES